MKGIAILVFLLLLLAVVVGFPIFLGIKIFKGMKERGLAVRDTVISGRKTQAFVIGTRMDRSGRGLRRVVEYEFEVDGQMYRGDVADRNLDKGETLEIEYNPDDPTQNFPGEMIDLARESAPDLPHQNS